MSDVMLDCVKHASKSLSLKCLGQQVRQALTIPSLFEPIEDEPKIRNGGDEKSHLPEEMGVIILVDRKMIDVGRSDARFA